MSARKLIAGNWKMNGLMASLEELRAMRDAVADGHLAHVDLLICTPATLVAAAAQTVGDAFPVGGQDCHERQEGAFTGNISATMLADAGATHVIVGHSERRTLHGETDALVRAKAEAARAAGLTAVICIGETEGEREAGQTLDVLGRQLAGSVPDGATAEQVVVAYEPVWAIGTGRTPTLDDVAEAHGFIRARLYERFGEAGRAMRLLYGGSVKPGNCATLLAVDNVDGALVGGASLKSADIVAICDGVRTLA
ncbi:triose-phosphate isomerase [Aureimonas sp. OT7]|uniref:triose-phosphate isomerase n=1 Tax=Aureimonas sp. OT7 TaxID=2816454 RepID=UPI001786FA9A|nr:triose-phosphate isomerase [Aureimonas sp. OT7]QOG05528.1 triose-phosphate isomerase [Aureimonas sp. OT7]